METSPAVALLIDFVIGMVILIVLYYIIQNYRIGQQLKGNKMLAEIWRSSGFPTYHLVNIEDNGKTVKVDDCTYLMAKEAKEGEYSLDQEEIAKRGKGIEEIIGNKREGKPYPIKRWGKWPRSGRFQRNVRLESWEEDNPEPIRPFYGTITADGKFIGHLHATASEITSLKGEAEAAGLIGQIEEQRARQASYEKAMSNLPNKTYLYLGIFLAIVVAAIGAFMAMQANGGISTILAAWGLK